MVGVVDLEADGADLPPNFVRRAEEPRRVAMAAAVCGLPAQALEDVGDASRGRMRVSLLAG